MSIATDLHPDKYIFSCHCQRNAYVLNLPDSSGWNPDEDFASLLSCNCSHCSKRRAIWFYTSKDNVEFIKGGDVGKGDLKEYLFGPKHISHRFCQDCGTHLLGVPTESSDESYRDFVGLNVRALRHPRLDLREMKTKLANGKKLHGDYVQHTLPDGAEAYLKERAKHYTEFETQIVVGGCHCGKISFGALIGKFEDKSTEVIDCNCSVCAANCILCAYPGRKDIYFNPSNSSSEPWQPDLSLVTRYTMKEKPKSIHYHVFCNECGVQIYQAEEADMKPDEGCWSEDYRDGMNFGLNIATLNNVDELISGDDIGGRVKGYKRNDGLAWGTPYIVKV